VAAYRTLAVEVVVKLCLFKALSLDVIVTGIRVPGPFDGIELVRRLRADERMTQNRSSC
jgi:hypothetical protein